MTYGANGIFKKTWSKVRFNVYLQFELSHLLFIIVYRVAKDNNCVFTIKFAN